MSPNVQPQEMVGENWYSSQRDSASILCSSTMENDNTRVHYCGTLALSAGPESDIGGERVSLGSAYTLPGPETKFTKTYPDANLPDKDGNHDPPRDRQGHSTQDGAISVRTHVNDQPAAKDENHVPQHDFPAATSGRSRSACSEPTNLSGSFPGALKEEKGLSYESSMPFRRHSMHDGESCANTYPNAQLPAKDAQRFTRYSSPGALASGQSSFALSEPISRLPGPFPDVLEKEMDLSSEETIQDTMSPRSHSTHGGTRSASTCPYVKPPKDANPTGDCPAPTSGQSESAWLEPTSTLVVDEAAKDLVKVSIPHVNIIIFGETGVGKSSVINLIIGDKRAQTSNDALGCTFKHERYCIELQGVAFSLWDTTGLDEGSEGTVPADVAEKNLRTLFKELARTGGIHLVIYCIRGSRLTRALKHNYDLFYVAICRRKVPVALVVTGLEHQEGGMETWWAANEGILRRTGMQFDAHACVTTLDIGDETVQVRRSESERRLHALMREYSKHPPWKIKQSFPSRISSTLRGVLRKTLSSGGPENIKTIRKVVICDVATNSQTLIQVSPGITALCQRYSGVIRDKQYEFVRVDKRSMETALQHKEDAGVLVFYTSALVGTEVSPEDISELKTFYENAGGHTCPVIVVLRDCNDEETARKLWGDVTSHHSDIRADFAFLSDMEDGLTDKLNEMIERLCIEHVEVVPPKAKPGKRFILTIGARAIGFVMKARYLVCLCTRASDDENAQTKEMHQE